jgi:hypothetical protein
MPQQNDHHENTKEGKPEKNESVTHEATADQVVKRLFLAEPQGSQRKDQNAGPLFLISRFLRFWRLCEILG